MSDGKENLINKTIKEVTFDLLKELVLIDTERPKDFLKKVRDINDPKDPEKLLHYFLKSCERSTKRS